MTLRTALRNSLLEYDPFQDKEIIRPIREWPRRLRYWLAEVFNPRLSELREYEKCVSAKDYIDLDDHCYDDAPEYNA